MKDAWTHTRHTVSLHSDTSKRTESVTIQRTPLGIDQPSPWQLFTGKCTHLPHCESTQNASGLVFHLSPMLPSENTQAEALMGHWTWGGSPQTHTHALTYTHVAHTQTELMKHENLKSQHANPVCLWDFFLCLNLYSNGQAEHIPRRNVIHSDSLGSRRSSYSR